MAPEQGFEMLFWKDQGFQMVSDFHWIILIDSSQQKTERILLELITDKLHSTSQNHRMVWVGRDLKDHLVPTPVMGRDTFH